MVVYVSHEQVFSEPILKNFANETGVKVRAIYDTERTKEHGRYKSAHRRGEQSAADIALTDRERDKWKRSSALEARVSISATWQSIEMPALRLSHSMVVCADPASKGIRIAEWVCCSTSIP